MMKRVEVVLYLEPDAYKELCNFSLCNEQRISSILTDWIHMFAAIQWKRKASEESLNPAPRPRSLSLWRSWWESFKDVAKELF